MSPKISTKSTKNATKRRNHKKRSTMRKRKQEQQFVIHKMLEMINVVKLYHWQTQSYSVHKATDKLYEKLERLNKPKYHENGRKKRTTKADKIKMETTERAYWKEHYKLFPEDKPKKRKRRTKKSNV